MAANSQLGGRVRFKIPYWCKFCKDRFVLRCLRGVKINFIDGKCPKQAIPAHEIKLTAEEHTAAEKQIEELLAAGCIKELKAPLPNGWISSIFLVPKHDSGFRTICNLQNLNKFCVYKHFHIDGVEKVLQMVRPLDLDLVNLDLVNAYGTIYIDSRYHHYFQFTFNNRHFCYVTIPQGYLDSPRLFSHCTTPISAYLRKNGVDFYLYLDDSFLRNHSAEILLDQIKFTHSVFSNCGFDINMKKSVLVPTQHMEFLGFLIDSVSYTVTVTQAKCRAFAAIVKMVLRKPSKLISLRFLAKIIGKVVSFFPASDSARQHYRILERFKTKWLGIKKSWSAKVILNKRCINELLWWEKNIFSDHHLTKSLYKPNTTQTIFTDSSSYGDGSVWGEKKLQGLFTEEQMKLSINTKELLAIYYTLGACSHLLSNEVVEIRCDNMVALQCIKSQGSRDSFRDRLTCKIFDMAKECNFKILIRYVKSAENCSDVISCRFDRFSVHTEWSLKKCHFQQLMVWAIVPPEVDMFASELNHQLPIFMSRFPCIGLSVVDAFSVCWTNIKGFLFAPFSLTSRIVKKCKDNQIKGMCGLFAKWESKSWWVGLMSMGKGLIYEVHPSIV